MRARRSRRWRGSPQALGASDAALGLYDLAGRIGAKRALRDIGMPEEGIARAAELALANPYWNPRPAGLRSDQATDRARLVRRAAGRRDLNKDDQKTQDGRKSNGWQNLSRSRAANF